MIGNLMKAVTRQKLKIFVSHSSADKSLVRKLVASLKLRGHDPWFDEASLPFGALIQGSISSRIASSDAFLLIYSVNAARSKWVDFEIDAFVKAEANGKNIVFIPVLIDTTPLPEKISDRKYISSTDSFPLLITQILTSLDGQSWHSVLLSREECRAETLFVTRGPVKVGRNNRQEYVDYNFLIDKYPVSRRKFMSFCFNGGYQDLNNYSARARSYMASDFSDFLECSPLELLAKRFPLDLDRLDWIDYPMCRLLAYEAEAYCRWVGGRLPKNAEWDKAAREDSGSYYPWGNSLEKRRCYTGQNRTDYWMPFNVYDFADGKSPCGAFNMAGRKQEFIGELGATYPSDLQDEILTRGWETYVTGSKDVPPYSLILEIGCFPVAAQAHAMTFRTVYPTESAYDTLLNR